MLLDEEQTDLVAVWSHTATSNQDVRSFNELARTKQLVADGEAGSR